MTFLLVIFSLQVEISLQLILDRISKGIQERVNKGSFIQRVIFKFAYDYKVGWVRRGYHTSLLDK